MDHSCKGRENGWRSCFACAVLAQEIDARVDQVRIQRDESGARYAVDNVTIGDVVDEQLRDQIGGDR